MATLNPHQREALDILRSSPLVSKVSYSYHKIRVWFKNGNKENYFLRGAPSHRRKYIPKIDLWLEDIPTYCEFESRPFEEHYNELVKPFFCVQYGDFAKAGFLRIRLKIQEIVSRILEEGWIDVRYPNEILENYWQSLLNISFVSKVPVNRLYFYRDGYSDSFKILLHFMQNMPAFHQNDRVPVIETWKSPQWLRRSVESCLRKRIDVTRANVIARLSNVHYQNRYSGINFINPMVYRVFFNNILKLKKPKVLHLNCDLGSALLGTGMVGGSYRCLKMTESITGISSLTKTEAKEYEGDPVDLCFDGLQPSSIDQILSKIAKYKSVAKTLVLCIKPEDVEAAKKIAKPDRIVQIKFLHWQQYYEGLFIYSKNTI